MRLLYILHIMMPPLPPHSLYIVLQFVITLSCGSKGIGAAYNSGSVWWTNETPQIWHESSCGCWQRKTHHSHRQHSGNIIDLSQAVIIDENCIDFLFFTDQECTNNAETRVPCVMHLAKNAHTRTRTYTRIIIRVRAYARSRPTCTTRGLIKAQQPSPGPTASICACGGAVYS